MEATLTRPPTHMPCVNVLKRLTHVMIRDDHAVCAHTNTHTEETMIYSEHCNIYNIQITSIFISSASFIHMYTYVLKNYTQYI